VGGKSGNEKLPLEAEKTHPINTSGVELSEEKRREHWRRERLDLIPSRHIGRDDMTLIKRWNKLWIVTCESPPLGPSAELRWEVLRGEQH